MTKKTLDWLNSNKYRAYPLVNDGGLLCGGVRAPDYVLLDCTVFDTNPDDSPDVRMKVTRYEVTDSFVAVTANYGGTTYNIVVPATATETSADGEEPGVVKVDATETDASGGEYRRVTFFLSTHAQVLESVGRGVWEFDGTVLPCKVARVNASGVMRLASNGCSGESGKSYAVGDVKLVDGYRTQPCVQNGRVVVKVGGRYGVDPCHYKWPDAVEETDCSNLMFFFCGQNAINSGDVAITGGPGVNVSRGEYEAKQDIEDTYGNVGIEKGEKVPCIEFVATPDLINIYRPTVDSEDSATTGS